MPIKPVQLHTPNRAFKLYAASKGIALWRVAEELGKHASNFCTELRKELDDAKYQRYIEIVDRLHAYDLKQ